MADPFKLVCSVCDFTTQDPAAFAEHMVAYPDHLGTFPIDAESGDLAELAKVLGILQRAADGGALPEGMEINPISEQDILDDDELSEEDKATILARLREFDEDEPE